MREGAQAKALRYLCEGRVLVLHRDARRVVADVRGDGVVYRCTHDAQRGWRCDCPARGRCCHLLALGSVVAVNRTSADR